MKNLLIAFLLSNAGIIGIATSAFATEDINTHAFVVIEDYNTPSNTNYRLESVPTSFCVGIVAHGIAKSIIQPVKIMTSYGCGSTNIQEVNINLGSCAKISSEEVEQHDFSVVKIAVDLSACGALQKDKDFVKTFEQAVRKSMAVGKVRVTSLTIK